VHFTIPRLVFNRERRDHESAGRGETSAESEYMVSRQGTASARGVRGNAMVKNGESKVKKGK